MARYAVPPLKVLPDEQFRDALARAPLDHYVIWNGQHCPGRAGSIRSRALGLIDEVWRPVPLRTLLMRAAQLSACAGLDPDTVRNAVRMHQTAGHACYFLVRRNASGDYAAVADVPSPSTGRRLRAGDIVLSGSGERFDETAAAPALGGA